MNESVIRLFLLGIAGISLPAAYLRTCVWLNRQRAWWFAYVAYFFLFGTMGGWMFTIAMSPSGLAAASTVFLFTFALAPCFASSMILAIKPRKGRAEIIAMFGGFLYPGLLLLMFWVTFLTDRPVK